MGWSFAPHQPVPTQGCKMALEQIWEAVKIPNPVWLGDPFPAIAADMICCPFLFAFCSWLGCYLGYWVIGCNVLNLFIYIFIWSILDFIIRLVSLATDEHGTDSPVESWDINLMKTTKASWERQTILGAFQGCQISSHIPFSYSIFRERQTQVCNALQLMLKYMH